MGQHRGIVASIIAAAPRVLALAAPPGFRKLEMARALAPHFGRLIRVELEAATTAQAVNWTIAEALAARSEVRAARAAADRLAFHADAVGPARDALRREWTLADGHETLVLRDPAGMLTSPQGADVLTELLGSFPPERTVVLLLRTPLPRALRQIAAPQRLLEVGPRELALHVDESLAAAEHVGVPQSAARAVHAIAEGWPLVVTMLLHAIRGDPGDLLDAAAAVAKPSLFPFGAHRVVAGLSPDVRDALAVVAVLGEASHLQLIRVLGDACDEAVLSRLCALPFITLRDERISIHPEVRALIRVRFEQLVGTMYERTLRVLTGEGRYASAARIALDRGDAVRAASIVDAAPPYTAAPVPMTAYGAIIDRIDRAMITRFPNVWIATIPYRSFAVDSATYVREAETVYFCMPASASDDQRAAVLMLLASAYVNFGRSGEADAIITEALGGFARARTQARAAILNFTASVRGIEGRFSAARALAAEAAEIAPDAFGEAQALHYIDAHEAAYRGKQDRVVVIADELLRRRKPQGLPLYIAHTALSAATFSWVNGDDAQCDRYLAVLEDAITPGLEAMFRPVIEAARGRAVRFGHDDPWPSFVALAYIYRSGRAPDDDEQRTAAEAAARAADARRDPYLRVLAHVLCWAVDGTKREDRSRLLREIAGSIESAELREAVDGLLGGGSPGMLEPLLRRVRRSTIAPAVHPSIELLSGRVTRDGVEIRLTDKEFELLALLALARGPLSATRIGEMLWEHLEPEEWRNNLKVTVYRIRKKLGDNGTIVSHAGGYRLAPAIDVDLRRIEALVREPFANGVEAKIGADLKLVVETYSDAVARYERYAWGHQLLARVSDAVSRAGMILASDAFRRGADAEALWLAARVRELDALNEDACELTIRLLLRRGDADGARREYQRFAQALASELNAKPSARVTALLRNGP